MALSGSAFVDTPFHLHTPRPSVILGASPGIQALPSHPLPPPSFSSLARESRSSVGNTSLDSRLLARMTDGEGEGHSRGVFPLRHSRGIPGNPGPPFLPIRQAGNPPRTPTWIPTFGENDGRGMWLFLSPSFSGHPRESRPSLSVSCVSFFRRHSRALPGNPVPNSLPRQHIVGPWSVRARLARARQDRGWRLMPSPQPAGRRWQSDTPAFLTSVSAL